MKFATVVQAECGVKTLLHGFGLSYAVWPVLFHPVQEFGMRTRKETERRLCNVVIKGLHGSRLSAARRDVEVREVMMIDVPSIPTGPCGIVLRSRLHRPSWADVCIYLYCTCIRTSHYDNRLGSQDGVARPGGGSLTKCVSVQCWKLCRGKGIERRDQ